LPHSNAITHDAVTYAANAFPDDFSANVTGSLP
jgi:hypothetical protein